MAPRLAQRRGAGYSSAMNILAFDTSFDACSVAVETGRAGGDRQVVSERMFMSVGHAEALIPMIGRVCAASGIGIADLDRIAVTHGPGTFTGVRIGVAAARALALAHGVPVVAFSSLLPLCMAAVHRIPDCVEDRDAVLVARDARREECYVEVVETHGRSLTGPLISSPAEAAALCPEYRLFATGSAAEAVARAGRAAGRPIAVDHAGSTSAEASEIDARWLLGFAHAASPLLSPPRPLYLRPPDARPQAGKSIARAGAAGT